MTTPVPTEIIQRLLDGERVCPECQPSSEPTTVEACPHRQAELETVLDQFYVTKYVPWWLKHTYWDVWPTKCSLCSRFIEECAVCGLICRCSFEASHSDCGPFCPSCMGSCYSGDAEGYSVDDILRAALAEKVLTFYTPYPLISTTQLTLPLGALS